MSEHLEQIHQLLDGELDSIHESALYAELAVNDDLREEMRDQVTLKNAVNNDRMALVPPAALTNSVFSGLGFAAPLAGASAGAVSSGMFMQWFSRLGIPILGAIAAAGITFGITSDSKPTSTVPASAQSQPVDAEQVTFEAIVGETPAITSASPRNIKRPTDPNYEATLAFYKQETVRLTSQLAASQARINELEAQRLLAISEPQVVQSNEANMVARQNMFQTPFAHPIQLTNSYNITRQQDLQRVSTGVGPLNYYQAKYPAWNAQLRGFSLTSAVQTDVNPERSWYSDLGVSVLYQVDEHNALGGELGNESYPMVFEGDHNGQIVRYDQNPSTMWAGVTYRYTGNKFSNLPIAPYGQALLGGSTYGPIGRMSAGLQYTPLGPLTFILGLEGSALIYRHQDNFHVSPKLGFTYGMAVRF